MLDVFFICAKSEVNQVSQPAVNCLVLIWQWYLRRSPTASFSINQMSCCFPEEPTSAAQGAATTAVGTGQNVSTTAVADSDGLPPDPPQLWSVKPVVNTAANAERSSFAIERIARATASQWQSGRTSSNSLRSSTDSYFELRHPMRSSTNLRPTTELCPNTRMLPVRSSTNLRPNLRDPPVKAPPPPIIPAAVRISSGSLPAFRKSPNAVLAAPRPSSVASTQPAQEKAPPACLTPLLAFNKPRVSSAAAPAATPIGGGQFVPQPQNRLSASSSSSSSLAQQPSATEKNPAASDLAATTAGDSSRKLPMQLTGSASLTASEHQLVHRHSLSSPDSRDALSSMCSPRRPGSYREVTESPITPDQLAGQFSRMRLDLEDIPQSFPTLHAAARAKQADALDHTPPQGIFHQHTRDFQAEPHPGSPVAIQPLKQHSQPDSSQHKQPCLDNNSEARWQSMPLSHPSVQARTEGHEGQCYRGLERQSPAESPPTPEHRKPTQRVLHFSPMPKMQPQAEAFHSSTLGRSPT